MKQTCSDRQSFQVRMMTNADVPAVAKLEAQNFSLPWSENGFLEALKQPGNIFVVIELSDGTIAAYCGLYASTSEGDITNVAVAEQMRQQGMGKAVVKEVLKRAKERGINQIFLEVRISNTAARKLYETCGFTECGIRKKFYQKPQEDAVLMRIELGENR